MGFFWIIYIMVLVFTTNYAISGSSHKNIVATRIESKIKIDGILDEVDWEKAVPANDFIQYDPVEGAEPSEKTSVKILYNENSLYVGVICYDSDPNGIKQQLTRRDRSSEADRFSITIDSYNDGQTGFVFVGNVSGVQSDGVLYHDGTIYDIQWDAVWSFEAKITKEGWSAEFEIPFNVLRFQERDDEYVWGINFRRYISRKKEIIEWVLIPRSETGSISKIGNLSGLKNIKHSLHLSVQPYILSSSIFEQELRPYSFEKVFLKNAGVDLKYSISSNFTLDGAINPDFGQVEVDQEVMNLTVFETHFPEKRPFFLEGGHIFAFGVSTDEKNFNLFYTRRIGRQPRFAKPDNVNEIIKYPKSTTILGAAKITGQTESGTNIGFITTVTDEEKLVYRDTSNSRKYSLIEPMASYNVIRLSQDINKNSTIGFMSTAAFLKNISPSIAGGFDWNLKLWDYKYAIDGYLVGSRQTNVYDKNLLDGVAGRIFFGKIAGKHWLFNTSYEFASKNFSIDELGYFSQPREHGGTSQLIYKEDQAEKFFLRYNLVIQADYRWNYQNLNTYKNIGIGSNFIFKNFWSVSFFQINGLSSYQGSERGYTEVYKTPTFHSFQLLIDSDTRKKISFKSHLIYEVDSKSKNEFYTSFKFTYRPISWLELNPMLSYAKRWNEETGVLLGSYYLKSTDTVTGKIFTVFGERDLNYFDLALRGIVTLTNKLSIQFFSQLMTYKWHYKNFKRIIEDYKLIPIDYSFYYQDLNYKIMNSNIVFRWEFLPGSTLYFAWTNSKESVNNIYHLNVKKDFSEIFQLYPNNVYLLKINYLFSY